MRMDDLRDLLEDEDMLLCLFKRIDRADGSADGVVTKEGWLSLLDSDADVRSILHSDEAAGEAEARSIFERMPPTGLTFP
eukprot:SAG31_NODE_20461_length_573_cov_2.518987_1_plen_80_part_00